VRAKFGSQESFGKIPSCLLAIFAFGIGITTSCMVRQNSEADSVPHGPAGRADRKNLPLVPVLMYHDILEESVFQDDVTIENFNAQMNWLKRSNYTTISLEQYSDAMLKGTPIPAKSVLLTFDDGYIGNYTHAKAILEGLSFKATFFVHTAFVGVMTSKDHMDWPELKEIDQSPLFEVYSHTRTHPMLTKITPEALKRELEESKNALELNLGGKREFLAFPFGDYNGAVITAAQNAGYKMTFGVVDRGTFARLPQFSIPRIGIGRNVLTLADYERRLRNESPRR
jgi:peptidoglycan/xylan/chitin deacetylase (PgdA/CDA1 family)